MSGAAREPDPDCLAEPPVGPEVAAQDDLASRAGGSPFEHGRPVRWPRMHADLVGAVFVGGCVGGWVRYAVGAAWPPPASGFPTATLSVNLAGAFLLAVVVIVATDIRPGRYLRPLLGTGFCGALTTFSSFVVSLAELLDRGAYALAAGYLAATMVGGLAAASLGIVLTRAAATRRHRAHRTVPSSQRADQLAERSA